MSSGNDVKGGPSNPERPSSKSAANGILMAGGLKNPSFRAAAKSEVSGAGTWVR